MCICLAKKSGLIKPLITDGKMVMKNLKSWQIELRKWGEKISARWLSTVYYRILKKRIRERLNLP